MKRVIATASVLGLSILSLLAADPAAKPGTGTPPSAPTEAPKKEPKKKGEPAEAKKEKEKAEPKTGEPSAADKALTAHAAKESAKLTEPQKAKLLDVVNTGDDKAVQDIPGVGAVKAANIKKARPLKTVDDLILVDGIGKVTFDGIVKWAEGDFKVAEEKAAPKKEPKAPKEAKKEEGKTAPAPVAPKKK